MRVDKADTAVSGKVLADQIGEQRAFAGSRLPDDVEMATPRIGVDYAGKWKDKPLRFAVRDSQFVSKR